MGYVSIPTDLTGYSKINSGAYTGNQTVNRAIPHGLGIAPKLIIFTRTTTSTGFIQIVNPGYIHYVSQTTISCLALTAADGTNFYIGNATDYTISANNLFDYKWTAMG